MSVELTTPRCACVLKPLNARHKRLTVSLGPADRFRFGRREGLEVSFPEDFRISSLHCTLLLRDGGVAVEDSSSNGTYVNGERVPRQTHRILNGGDQLFLVIPNNALLQSGYSGSLTQNFVGYVVELASPPSTAPIAPAPAADAEWRPAARGPLPSPAPAAPTRLSEIPTVRTNADELLLPPIERRVVEPSAGGIAEHSDEGCPSAETSRSAAATHYEPPLMTDSVSFAAWSLVNMAPGATRTRTRGAPAAAATAQPNSSSSVEPLSFAVWMCTRQDDSMDVERGGGQSHSLGAGERPCRSACAP